MWARSFTSFMHPRTFLSSSGLGTMGFGLPAAMGAKAANPDKLVVDIDGDGSFLMNIQELATAYCEKLPVKVLLLNNQHLGMVMQWEDRFHQGNRRIRIWGRSIIPKRSAKADGLGPKTLSRLRRRLRRALAAARRREEEERPRPCAEGNDRVSLDRLCSMSKFLIKSTCCQ